MELHRRSPISEWELNTVVLKCCRAHGNNSPTTIGSDQHEIILGQKTSPANANRYDFHELIFTGSMEEPTFQIIIMNSPSLLILKKEFVDICIKNNRPFKLLVPIHIPELTLFTIRGCECWIKANEHRAF